MQTIKYILLICVIGFSNLTYGQNGVQNVKGTILDKQSEIPLLGATIQLVSAEHNIGTTTDFDGNFTLEGVPVGRQAFQVDYLGYETLTIPNVEVTSGKEVFLNIEMEESLVKLEEVVITAGVDKDRSINDMATVSARQFSMEEVNRFSGGRSDVGRLAGNFAGVSTADDSRNDIVIRGNSPAGLLWRLEGIPIPSPNHFSTVGTTGGPVSALNPNFLKNSDFMTSAFPSEYGNALSGVFDLGFRSGNKDEMEYMMQLGAITGLEANIEGPISKENGSSFIVGYRYSFLGIAQALGMDIGTNAIPNYSDLSFKLDLGKSRFGNFSIFGVGGVSDIEFLHDEIDENDLFAAADEDTRAESRFGVIGLRHNLLVDDRSYVRTVLGLSGNGVKFSRDRYYNQNTPDEFIAPFVVGDDSQSRVSISSYYNSKINSQLTIRTGVLYEQQRSNLSQESAQFGIDDDNDGVFDLIEVYRFDERTNTVQPFAQAQYRVNEKLTLNGGLHGVYYDLNDDISIEPRAAINYQLLPRHAITIGYGLHSQTQPIPMQLNSKVVDGITVQTNKDLELTKSHHFVIGHDYKINKQWRSKIELYRQQLYNVPVDPFDSPFSMLNVGADFGFPLDKHDLVNEGTGVNQGVELTIERFFSNGFYLLTTGSVFDSKYTASDGIERNTAFNNQYVLNLLGGKEFEWGKNKQHRFTVDTKLTTAGGRFYTPVDLEASKINEIEVLDIDEAFTLQYDPYFRWDIKVGVKLNSSKRKFAQGFYFDIQNVTDNENIFRQSYNRNTNQVNDVYQIGFFPNFMYKVEF